MFVFGSARFALMELICCYRIKHHFYYFQLNIILCDEIIASSFKQPIKGLFPKDQLQNDYLFAENYRYYYYVTQSGLKLRQYWLLFTKH